MTKNKVVRNFGENRRELFQDFLSENKFPQNFCPPIFLNQIFAPMFFDLIFCPPFYLTPFFCPLNICDPNFCPPIFMTSLRRCLSLSVFLIIVHVSQAYRAVLNKHVFKTFNLVL